MEFLLRVYRSTREEELAMIVDWTEEMKDAFIRLKPHLLQVKLYVGRRKELMTQHIYQLVVRIIYIIFLDSKLTRC